MTTKVILNKIDYPEDCRQIRDAIEGAGYECSLTQAETIWSLYSNSMCAQWLVVHGTPESIFEAIESYIEIGNR